MASELTPINNFQQRNSVHRYLLVCEALSLSFLFLHALSQKHSVTLIYELSVSLSVFRCLRCETLPSTHWPKKGGWKKKRKKRASYRMYRVAVIHLKTVLMDIVKMANIIPGWQKLIQEPLPTAAAVWYIHKGSSTTLHGAATYIFQYPKTNMKNPDITRAKYPVL